MSDPLKAVSPPKLEWVPMLQAQQVGFQLGQSDEDTPEFMDLHGPERAGTIL